MAAASGDREELKSFVSALKSQKLTNNQWLIGTASDHYPTHGILRRMAVVKAFNGDQAGSVCCLSRLRNIIQASKVDTPVFEAILAATLVQLAKIQYKPGTGKGSEYLSNKINQKEGAKQLVEKLIKRTEKSHPKMAGLFQAWLKQIDSVIASKVEPGSLSSIGRQVGY